MSPSLPHEPSKSVTSRALAVLGAFDFDHMQLRLSAVARRAGLPLTTTHRLVNELVAWGALERQENGTFVVGRRVWELGLLAPVHLELREVALPFMQDLYEATRDKVSLAVREGLEALYVERIYGRAAMPIVSRVGSHLPLHSTGVGKVLLAYAPPDVVEGVLRAPSRSTSHTITDRDRLLDQLAEVRRRGYASTSQEMTMGIFTVAVPVLSPSGEVIAAMSLVATRAAHLHRLVPALQVASSCITRALVTARVPHTPYEWSTTMGRFVPRPRPGSATPALS